MRTEYICPSAKSIRHGAAMSAIALTLRVPAFAGTTRGNMVTSGLVDRPDQGLDLVRMRAELLGELVEIGIGDFLKTRLVDVGDDLDAQFLEFRCRRTLELERAFGFLHADISGRGHDPLLLVGVETLPELVADPHDRVVGFMLGHRQYGRSAEDT